MILIVFIVSTLCAILGVGFLIRGFIIWRAWTTLLEKGDAFKRKGYTYRSLGMWPGNYDFSFTEMCEAGMTNMLGCIIGGIIILTCSGILYWISYKMTT
jgi:hypothetical protein